MLSECERPADTVGEKGIGAEGVGSRGADRGSANKARQVYATADAMTTEFGGLLQPQLGAGMLGAALDALDRALASRAGEGREHVADARQALAEFLEAQRREADATWSLALLPIVEAEIHRQRDRILPGWLPGARREPDGTWVGRDPDNPDVVIEVAPSGRWSWAPEDDVPMFSAGYVRLRAMLSGESPAVTAERLAVKLGLREGDHA